MEQCKICQGSGLRMRTIPYVCPVMHSVGVVKCMHCENISKGKYVTCEECLGAGEKRKDSTQPNTS